MKMTFDSPSIEKEYYDAKYIKRKYGQVFSVGLEKMLCAIEAAECANDIKSLPQYKMHLLHGDMRGVYSLSPDNKKSKWRVPALCLDENDKVRIPDVNNQEIDVLKETKKFRIGKIGDYHD